MKPRGQATMAQNKRAKILDDKPKIHMEVKNDLKYTKQS
jgi:hypothetical protein